MMDLIKIAAALLGGYAVSMGLMAILIKAFFPFRSPEEMERQKIAEIIND